MRGDNCYQIVYESKSWDDASVDCKDKGGYLASIHTQAENDFIYSKFISTSALKNNCFN